jgi:alpha-N-acetylglucosaminidase
MKTLGVRTGLVFAIAFALLGTAWAERRVWVVVGPEEPPPVRYAAEDLAGFLGRLCACSVSVSQTIPHVTAQDKVFLLATPASQAGLPGPIAALLAPEKLARLGPDGCLAKCVPPLLLLAGDTARGAANAVWTYLEDYCHVGFFWSHDFVPRLEALRFEEVSFEQKPYFGERYTSPPGGYTLAEFMTWPDWKRELDWRVHKRQNMIFGAGSELVWKHLFAELSGKTCDLTETERSQDELYRQIVSYARDRGLMLVMPGFMGEVPAEFVAAHPNVRYLGGTRWGEVPMSKHIYPSDPMFHDLSVRYIRAYTARYGPTDFYFVSPYPEARPGETPEEQHNLKSDFVAAVQKVLAEALPNAVWLADSWAFLSGDFWTPEEVRAFCDAITIGDRFRIYDTWGEERPMWSLHHAYWGKKWSFGVLQCFGGMTMLHGDVPALVRDVQRLTTDARARQCVGLYLVPEALHHNDLYFDVAMRLQWNPEAFKIEGTRVELDEYLRDYALRRYGPRSGSRMWPILKELTSSVYASKDMTQPLYLHQLFTLFDFPNASVYAPLEQAVAAPKLRRLLERALAEAPEQRLNPLYEQDIVDLARRYLGDLFNGIVPDVIHAWRKGDAPRFEQARRDAAMLMGHTEQILWASHPYRLCTRAERVGNRPDQAQQVAQARNVMSIWEGSANLDYARRDDIAELIAGYYVPRFKAWTDLLASVAPNTWSQADDDYLTKTYWDIGKKWVAEGATMPAPAPSAEFAIRLALDAARPIERRLPRPARETVNLSFLRGLDGWSLSARRMELSFEPDAAGGKGKTLSFKTWPKSSGGNLYLFQTVKAGSADISLDCRPQVCGESGFMGLRAEGYDAAFRRVVECTYQWGDATNHWPDRYRPDNVTPDWNVGATGFVWWWVGHYAIKQRLGPVNGQWQHLHARPAADVDRIHGAGTWSRLGVRMLRIALVASSRRVEDPLAGSFAHLNVNLRR